MRGLPPFLDPDAETCEIQERGGSQQRHEAPAKTPVEAEMEKTKHHDALIALMDRDGVKEDTVFQFLFDRRALDKDVQYIFAISTDSLILHRTIEGCVTH